MNKSGNAVAKVSTSTTESRVDIENLEAELQLPEKLILPKLSLPSIPPQKRTVKWSDILKETEEFNSELEEYKIIQNPILPKAPFQWTECDFIKTEVFGVLIPVLEETLDKAKIWQTFHKQRCFFNGIDHIAQELWSNNPRYPLRKEQKLHVFNIPFVQKALKENPRPYYPKSWLWPEDYAATVIQKTVRQYFVQREEEVHEMRTFWKKLKIATTHTDELDVNPFLRKSLAMQTLSELRFQRKN